MTTVSSMACLAMQASDAGGLRIAGYGDSKSEHDQRGHPLAVRNACFQGKSRRRPEEKKRNETGHFLQEFKGGGSSADKMKPMLTLTLKEQPTVPLEAECISPDIIAPLALDAIRGLAVFHGKRHLRLDDFFTIEGEPSNEIEVHGDTSRVKWIGKEMTRGHIRVSFSCRVRCRRYRRRGSCRRSCR